MIRSKQKSKFKKQIMIRGVTPNNNWHHGLSRIIIFVQFIKTLLERSIHLLYFLKTLRMFPEKNYVI